MLIRKTKIQIYQYSYLNICILVYLIKISYLSQINVRLYEK